MEGKSSYMHNQTYTCGSSNPAVVVVVVILLIDAHSMPERNTSLLKQVKCQAFSVLSAVTGNQAFSADASFSANINNSLGLFSCLCSADRVADRALCVPCDQVGGSGKPH